MRLVMYLLLSANLVLAILVWLDYRTVTPLLAYEPEKDVERILLLSDGTKSLPQAEEGRDVCWLFGPMSQRQVALDLKSRLAEVDYFSSVVESQIEKAPGYWVYYGPISAYQDSLAQLREFRRKNIDSFIITKEELKGSISLGVFDNIDSAKRMLAIMKRKGYDTRMAEIPRQDTEYWVSLTYPSDSSLEQRFERYLAEQNGSLEGRQIFCK